jgi:hypothetical protein
MVWGWQNRNISLVVFGKNDADCRFSPMLCPHFLFFLKKSKFGQYLTFYELFKIDSYCAVAIKWKSWYNERRNAEKTSLDCSQLGRVGRE